MKQELYITRALEWFDFWATDFIKLSDYPGFSISMAKGNEIVFSKSYGFNAEEPLKDDALFRMASHSKNMTAIAIMQLVEQKKLDLDDKISKYIDCLNLEDKGFKTITVRQVLNHSAGIKRDGDDSSFWQKKADFPTKDELRAFLRTTKTYVKANTQLKYSNIGYGLLGLVIEKVTGIDYNDYIQKTLFSELNDIAMDTHLVDKSRISKGRIGKAATGKFGTVDTSQSTNALSSATGLVATTKSMCKFYQNLYFGNESLITDESKKELFKANFKLDIEYDVDYGLGFRCKDYKNNNFIGHSGGFPGTMSSTTCEPKEKIVISCAINSSEGGSLSIIETLVDFIELAKNNKHDLAEQEEYKLNEVMVSLWGSTLLFAVGKKIYTGTSEYTSPTYNGVIAERIGDTNKYKLIKTSNTGFFNETAELFFDENKVLKNINWCGTPMVRRKDFVMPE